MQRFLVCAGLLLASLAHAAPVGWVTDFGQPLGALTGQDDAQQAAALGFAFPFAGASYSTIWISTNGFLNLGSPAALPADASVSAVLSAASPVIAPFYADLDLLDQGTVYFWSNGGSAVVTWDHVGAFANLSSPFTFQAQLDASGQVTYRYNGLSSGTALNSSLLVGLSSGNGAPDPGEQNLLTPFMSASATVYQKFSAGAQNGVDAAAIMLRPVRDGFDVTVTDNVDTPEPASAIFVLAGVAGIWLWRKRTAASIFVLLGMAVSAGAQQDNTRLVGIQPDGTYIVPTGQAIQPIGKQIDVRDRPLGMVVSPDGSTLAVVTGSNFNPRALYIIDLATNTLKQTISIGDSFVGVDFTNDGNTLYVGGGTGNSVLIFSKNGGGQFVANGTIAFAGSAPSGLKLNPANTRLYVALNLKNTVAVIDAQTRAVLAQVPVGTYPYTTVVSRDGSKVYVSNWGGRIPGPGDTTDGTYPVVVDPRTGIPISGTVSVIDAASNQVVKTITIDRHPCGMALSPAGDRLYMTNANSDTVSVIDTGSDAVVKTLTVTFATTKSGSIKSPVLGSSPNAVPVSRDGTTLYVANASDNAIAVVDPNSPTQNPVLGLIPTGWYPTAVTTDLSGKSLIVANGYGFGSVAVGLGDRA